MDTKTAALILNNDYDVMEMDNGSVLPIKPVAKVKKCKECGEILPLENFRMGRHGRVHVYNKCTTQKRRANKEERVMAQRRQQAMHDEMFEGKQPCEVLQIMGRAKRWLEARGYEITLRGSLMVKKDVKFE